MFTWWLIVVLNYDHSFTKMSPSKTLTIHYLYALLTISLSKDIISSSLCFPSIFCYSLYNFGHLQFHSSYSFMSYSNMMLWNGGIFETNSCQSTWRSLCISWKPSCDRHSRFLHMNIQQSYPLSWFGDIVF